MTMPRLLPLLLVSLAMVVAACGDDGGDGDEHGAGHGESSAVAEGARAIAVRATSFEFDPPTITAEVGEDLAIELSAEDPEHDFVIDELDAHVSAGAGATETGGFNTGDEAGTYTYYCSMAGHREAGMVGELIVE